MGGMRASLLAATALAALSVASAARADRQQDPGLKDVIAAGREARREAEDAVTPDGATGVPAAPRARA